MTENSRLCLRRPSLLRRLFSTGPTRGASHLQPEQRNLRGLRRTSAPTGFKATLHQRGQKHRRQVLKYELARSLCCEEQLNAAAVRRTRRGSIIDARHINQADRSRQEDLPVGTETAAQQRTSRSFSEQQSELFTLQNYGCGVDSSRQPQA